MLLFTQNCAFLVNNKCGHQNYYNFFKFQGAAFGMKDALMAFLRLFTWDTVMVLFPCNLSS